MSGKRFSKNMIRRIALSGDVANAYALGRTMQEKHTPFANASAVQAYSDGTRLHTLKSGSYRRLYATGGGQIRLWQGAGAMIFPWQMHFVIDKNKQCYFIGRDPDAGVATNWTPILEGVKMRAVVPEFGFTLFLAEDGRLWGIGGWAESGLIVGLEEDIEVWPPQRLTPFDDWVIVSVENSEDVSGVRSNGTLWEWGADVWLDPNELSTVVLHTDPLERLPEFKDWVWCDTFLSHTSAMRANGEIWHWEDVILAGSDALGPEPKQLLGPDKKHLESVNSWPYKRQITYNSWYLMAIFDDGRLYYVGFVDIFGPEGLNTNVWTPVSDKNDWWFVEAQDIRPAFAVDLSGDLYAYGDLFNTDDSFDNESGWGVFIIGDVQQVTLYDRTAIVLKKDGTLWGWGNNRRGSLGLPKASVIYPPQQMRNVNKNNGKIEFSSDWAWVDIHNETTIAAKKNGDRYWCGFMGRNTPTGVATDTIINVLVPIDPKEAGWLESMDYREARL